jgi:hypothetical protein
MAALTLGLAGLSFGLVAETGGKIQNIEIRNVRDKATVKDETGGTVGATYYDPRNEINFEAFVTGATGIAAASPGVALTVANFTPGNGTIIAEEVTTRQQNVDYKKITVKAMNWAAI